jgi:hypothetical protein
MQHEVVFQLVAVDVKPHRTTVLPASQPASEQEIKKMMPHAVGE